MAIHAPQRSDRGDRARRSRIAWVRTAILLGLIVLATAAPAEARASGVGRIVELPASFKVQNVNRTAAPCPVDGRGYRISGHLVAPRSVLGRERPRTITIWLHGSTSGGEFMWRFKQVPGLDFAFEMARRGHASLIVDQLGYGASDHPADGNLVCGPGHADMAHQIVDDLRRGDYAVVGGSPVRFDRIAIGGNSAGAAVAETEVYTFDDVDALVAVDWAEQGFSTNFLAGVFSNAARRCAPGEPKAPGGERGYGFLVDDEDLGRLFYASAADGVIDAHRKAHERDVCGLATGVGAHIFANRLYIPEIDVPVLLIYGRDSAVFNQPQAGTNQAQRFTGTDDLSLEFVEGAGHVPMLDGPAEAFRAKVSGWLSERGF